MTSSSTTPARRQRQRWQPPTHHGFALHLTMRCRLHRPCRPATVAHCSPLGFTKKSAGQAAKGRWRRQPSAASSRITEEKTRIEAVTEEKATTEGVVGGKEARRCGGSERGSCFDGGGARHGGMGGAIYLLALEDRKVIKDS
uniref:Uncharacterized protein n=1 Tax=Arundo donax TaxID=35708 RepID=A0A0A9HPN5_ARUDO